MRSEIPTHPNKEAIELKDANIENILDTKSKNVFIDELKEKVRVMHVLGGRNYCIWGYLSFI